MTQSTAQADRIDGAEDSNDWAVIQNRKALVQGNFVGSTDEIIQWSACLAGLDETDMRAKAAKETDWRQWLVGDGGQSKGLYQDKVTVHPCPNNACQASTSWGVAYGALWQRACVDGDFGWLGSDYQSTVANYASGTNATRLHEGCIGAWFSGNWYDSGAVNYINSWRTLRANHQYW